MDLGGDAPPFLVSLYYDPLLDVHHRLPVMTAVINALYLAPTQPDDARRLFDAGVDMVGALGPGPPGVIGERMTAVSLLLAREWGLDDTADRLAAGAEASYEPTWDRDRGEFTWGFGIGEPHPRGQWNALMAAAEAITPGAWTALANDRPPDLPGEVVGVDFPTVTMRQASWSDGALHLTTTAVNEGAPTTWRVQGLDDPAHWTVTATDGVPVEAQADGNALRIETRTGDHTYVVHR